MKENLTNRMILFLRKLRQVFSRSKWVVRLLSLPPFWDATPQHGVILIQIDALSRPELERTIRAGRMPFLKKLLQENYRLCSHYSGLPSTTPAVQAELLYGVPGVIPAFSFRDHQTGELTSMIDFDDASRIENRLKQIGKGLLQDGGAYCDMYTGGAMHASFCASSPGLDSRLRQSGPVALFISLVLHGFIAVRMLGLFLVEVVLAIIDVFRGVIKGKNLWKELHFIPYRIGVCILLRELTTAGVLIDAALGLPIIHCNFLGYDEHAHRRGPSSTFAHLTLRGIDNCLRRIRDFSTSVASREYDLLIYSDHGQEATLPYEVLTCVSGASSFLRPLDLRQIVLQFFTVGPVRFRCLLIVENVRRSP